MRELITISICGCHSIKVIVRPINQSLSRGPYQAVYGMSCQIYNDAITGRQIHALLLTYRA